MTITPQTPADAGFGKRVVIPEAVRPTYESWEYLRHFDGPHQRRNDVAVQSSATTKFHRGFQRRRAGDIFAADEMRASSMQYAAERQRASGARAAARCARLAQIDHKNGYNVLTGQPSGGVESDRVAAAAAAAERSHPGSHYVKKDCVPRETEMDKVAQILLRDSHYRFFAPQTTGNNLIYRQEVSHYSEGLKAQKSSSVLGVGRNDIPSFGVEDQFQYAKYGDRNFHPALGTTAVAKKHHAERLEDIEAVRNLR